ncbi:MAG: septum formation protein Maf [Chloroflexi bacterium]|nr:septum formation protein Maf [Chloroflexota bacterium]
MQRVTNRANGRPCPPLLLASASPRRRRLIGLLGLPCEAVAAEVDETPRPGEKPERLATRLARAKVQAVAPLAGGRLVVAADSVVVLHGRTLGKPASARQATAMLRRLRGQRHQVLTGVALLAPDSALSTQHSALSTGARYEGLVRTEVQMRAYGDAEIAAYVASGAPMDKAGAYGIQDLAFHPVERVLGCYLNVVGLPLCELVRGLATLGCTLPALDQAPFVPPCALCCQGAELVQIGTPGRLFLPMPNQ